MSGSVDRILTNWSIDGTGPLTRGISEVSTSGWIDEDATHWSIEPFLPIETQTLVEYLSNRAEKTAGLDPAGRDAFQSAVQKISDHVAAKTSQYHAQFSDRYHAVDPDSDCKIPIDLQSEQVVDHSQRLMELCDQILADAAYQKLSQEDIEKCVGVSSHWGVPMSANFGLFQQLAVYARGDIIGRRYKRRLQNLYRMEMVDVAIYQRLVVLFQLAEDHERGEMLSAGQFHLRIFKNIPKQDVDMLLPGTQVRLSKLDRVKVIAPSLGGWLLSLQKISRFVLVTLALAAYYSTALVIGLILAGIGYCVKSFFSYFQTKNRYLLDLTRNLYFQKLDTNAGAAFQIIQQAGRQSTNEASLAYYALATEAEPISRRRLRRKCERLIREAIEVEIDFRVDRALETLLQLGLVTETIDQKLCLVTGAGSAGAEETGRQNDGVAE
ncbi:TMEM143 family protein [Stieleria sp. ICT_E10.1]|uniref:TMEM143 family protein n=1 Tax=Stieleria sedimenti TaxID=2976331 RepID=UPI0021808F01|nr:TMEM143 family protein [Stieleria sedimenti]MCS7467527.1 TMEM143 family protein [Stieleria sedimenti]